MEESAIIEEEEETFDLRLDDPPYLSLEKAKVTLAEEVVTTEGKIHRRYSDGRREILFPNGVRRELWDDGYSLVYFTNGDLKQTYPPTHRKGQRLVYFYAEAKTTQTTYPNGLQVYKFANGQIEKHFSDGTKEI